MKKLLGLCFGFAILSTWVLAQTTGQPTPSWVWDEADANTVAQSNSPRYLRHSFIVNGKVLSATLHVTADNHYVAYVNGYKAGADGEWATIEKYDVAKHLVEGKNVLAIKATNQGGVAGVTAWLQITTSEKKSLLVALDEKTKITQSAPDNWESPTATDAGWGNAIVLGDLGIAPWNLTGGGAKGKGKKGGGGQFGYDTNETVAVKGRLTPEEQIKHFVVPKDFTIELVAADPLVINPITMVMDEKGRIIVSESHTYRYGPPGSPIKPYANPVIRLDPDGKGGLKRTLIADGFADPVMGIAVKPNRLWLTANNYLYTYDLPELAADLGKGLGLATNKKSIVTDLNKAWNPFGMFVLEWGPDGKLYMSVGNHAINLQGPDKDKMSGRGSSGIVVRMEPDGSKMERLVHGLRVPYSFEMDPFGQLWVLSNGEGNPNRFVRVIDGVDYHCYSRGAVDNNWLAGNHPLAPPSEELHRGAHTQLMRYYGAAYPQEYQGNLFLCNWGAHGYAGPNRAINRFVLDERNNVVGREPLVWCKDPHFRPAHIILDHDGSLLIADWYGRDDESDLTGRIWRLKYVGKDAPVVKHKLESAEWKNDEYAISALGSPSHLVREKAIQTMLVPRSDNRPLVKQLADYVSQTKDPLGAASAVWTLYRIGGPAKLALAEAAKNPDWTVRRLSLHVLRGSRTDEDLEAASAAILNILAKEKDPAVLVEVAIAIAKVEPDDLRGGLVRVIVDGAASDVHLRYEAASHLAKVADEKSITKLLTSDDANVRLAGLIAIDVACYENFPSKKAALAALAKAIENPGKLDHQLLLTVAQLDGDATIVPALEKLIARDDVPAATVAKAFLVLKAKAGASFALKAQGAGKRFIEAVESGQLKIASPADQLVLLEFLESEGPTPFALKQIGGQLQSNNKELRQAAHTLARRFGPKASALADQLWPGVVNPKTKFEDALESLSTIARIEGAPKTDAWLKMLEHEDSHVRTETVRWWRIFKDQPSSTGGLLGQRARKLIARDDGIKEDLATVIRHIGVSSKELPQLHLPEQEKDKDVLTKNTLKELATMPAADRAKRSAMGQQVFERNACTKCHTTATATTPLAPSLKGIAAQKVDYLIESVLHPSKVIKTGWEVELIETKDGKVVTGLVKDDGKTLRVIQAMDYLKAPLAIDKANVEARRVSKISLMPDGQEANLSRREFVDLIAYLQTLK